MKIDLLIIKKDLKPKKKLDIYEAGKQKSPIMKTCSMEYHQNTGRVNIKGKSNYFGMFSGYIDTNQMVLNMGFGRER